MSFVVFKGERNIADVVSRAYGELKASDRKRAEAALVRANPHLAEIKDVAEGSLIVVPRVPGVRESADREAESPAADAVGEIAEALTDYRKRLEASAKREEGDLSELEKLLESGPLREKLGNTPEAGPYLDRAAEAAKDRRTENEERKAILERLEDAETRLAELVERLG
jgi:hypothetical protein